MGSWMTDVVGFRNAQVAVMDTYVGKAKAALLLANATGDGNWWSIDCLLS